MSLLSRQDMQRMNTEENHSGVSHSSSHDTNNGPPQQSNTGQYHQNPPLSPESLDDNTQSVLQNFSKDSYPYQRLNDSQSNITNNGNNLSNSNLAMVNGNQPTKATDILKPRVGNTGAGGFKARHTRRFN